jgi:hypothetical protein
MYSVCPLLCIQCVLCYYCDPTLDARVGSPTLRRLVGAGVLMVVYEEWLVKGAAKAAFMPIIQPTI